jgi:hypothetical protein
MATTTTINTTYAGEKAAGYIRPAILGALSLKNGGFTVKENVKYREVLKRSDIDAQIVTNGSCDFTPTGTITLGERILEPKELQVNRQVCRATFRNDWDALQMGASIHDNLPKSLADFIIEQHVLKVQAETERSLYVGLNANNGEFTGISQILATDSDLPASQEVTGTTVNAGNVQAEMRKVLDAMPTRVYMQADLKLRVPRNVYFAYVQSLGGFGANGLGANGIQGQGPLWYNTQALYIDGVEVFLAPGMADNTMILAQSSNLYAGTMLLSDMNELRVIDMADIDGSQNIRFVLRYAMGTQIGIIEDVVSYGIPNSNN